MPEIEVQTLDRRDVAAGGGQFRGFPAMARAANGDLVVMYRKGTGHAEYGQVFQKISADGGLTWGDETLVKGNADSTINTLNPAVFTAATGAMYAFVAEKRVGAGTIHDALWATSMDHGQSWSAFVPFDPAGVGEGIAESFGQPGADDDRVSIHVTRHKGQTFTVPEGPGQFRLLTFRARIRKAIAASTTYSTVFNLWEVDADTGLPAGDPIGSATATFTNSETAWANLEIRDANGQPLTLNRGAKYAVTALMVDAPSDVTWLQWRLATNNPYGGGHYIERPTGDGEPWNADPAFLNWDCQFELVGESTTRGRTMWVSSHPLILGDGTIYLPAIGGNPNFQNRLWTSTDHGATWELISEIGGGCDEWSLAELPDGRFVAVFRRTNANGTHLRYSEDRGVTWGDPIDISPQVERFQDPELTWCNADRTVLMLAGRERKHADNTDEQGVAYFSQDGGATWTNRTVIVDYSEVQYVDGGYTSTVRLADNELLTVYYGGYQAWPPDIGSVRLKITVSPNEPLPPSAATITLGGEPRVGETLTGGYTFISDTSEGASAFRWLRADTADGEYTAIGGATEQTYTLTPEDAGKFIVFEVTPVDAGGTVGEAATSAPTGPVYVLGDFNGDGVLSGLDIPGFKQALADPDGWAEVNPGRPHPNALGDFNGDGVFSGLDIPGFKQELAGH